MIKKILFTLSFSLLGAVLFSQATATIKGKVLDEATSKTLEFANVVLFKNGVQVGGTKTSLSGKYTFTSVTPGEYDIIVTYVGYQKTMEQGVRVTTGIEFVDIKVSKGVKIDEVKIISHKIPLIDKGKTSSGGSVGSEDIKNMAARSANDIVKTIANVTSQDDGSGTINVRGSRSNATDVYIDGIRVRGSQNLPAASIQQVTAVTGGLPAQYGDVTGGIINITTRGATKNWFGGVEVLTSGAKIGKNVIGLDNFGFNLLALSLSGPLLLKGDSGKIITSFSKRLKSLKSAKSKAGFFISSEFKHQLDPRPYSTGDWKVKDEVLERLNSNPLQNRTGGGDLGLINSASFLRASDIEKTAYRQNVAAGTINLAGKIDVNVSDLSTVTFGGSFNYGQRNQYLRNTLSSYSLLNSQNNPHTTDLVYRIYGRYIQRFENQDDKQLVRDAYFSVQADYSYNTSTTGSSQHNDQLNRYGYLGKFTSERAPSYDQTPSSREILNANGDVVRTLFGIMQNGTPTTNYSYTPDFSVNPTLANYTANYYEIYKNSPDRYTRPQDVTGGGGLLNGTDTRDVYGLYSAQGTPYNLYSKTKQWQLRFSASGNATIKNHSLKVGVTYEQRNSRSYSIQPRGLWTVGRQLVNSHTTELSNLDGEYTLSTGPGGIGRYSFNQKNASPGAYVGGSDQKQAFFDFNVRKKLGLNTDGVDYIDFDSYGVDLWNISFFSADDLLNNYSTSRPFFRGYTHDGKEVASNVGISSFFKDVDEYGNKQRLTAPFQPIYIAGYIQDQFLIDEIVFNIGVRIDRYDANQSILKDKYSLFPVRKVGDLSIPNKPSNIGDSFVPYVRNSANPSANTVVGYRDGDTWYNSDGEEIADPSILSSDGVPDPWLVNKNNTSAKKDLSEASFEKYTPQINVSPRVAFSFPLSEEALFYAHYDVLVQRPKTGSALNLLDYLLLQDNNNIINNPNLRSERTIDFQVGFQQKLNDYSAFKFSAFYRDMRDMVQLRRISGAFPENYRSYENVDFGTVKGVTLQYDLRRMGNVSLRASYTLQFASGTGSNATSALNSVSSGLGNVQTIFPLDFDQRHAILATLDYRYSDGEDYNGPEWGDWSRKVFQNLGFNLVSRLGSGRPYTRAQYATGRVLHSPISSPIEGSVNTANYPWNYTVDLKIDKTMYLKSKADLGNKVRKNPMSLTVYIQFLNLLNTRNQLFAYTATGSATNDGYLESARYVTSINSRQDVQSFKDLYNVKVNNPNFYSIPRRIQLGIQFNF